jgi:hypothetical protein
VRTLAAPHPDGDEADGVGGRQRFTARLGFTARVQGGAHGEQLVAVAPRRDDVLDHRDDVT